MKSILQLSKILLIAGLLFSSAVNLLLAQTIDKSGVFSTPIEGDTLIYTSVYLRDLNENGSTDVLLSLSENEITQWSDYSAAVIFKDSHIIVRDGDTEIIPENEISLQFNTQYHIWVAINVETETYTTWVKTNDMYKPELIYANAAFRKTGVSSISYWSALHNPTGEPDSLEIDTICIAPKNYTMNMPGGTDGSLSNVDISGLGLNYTPFTVEMWIKSEGDQAAYAGLFYHRDATDAGLQYAASWQGANLIRGNIQNSGNDGLLTSAVPTDQWHHVALVVNGTNRKIYLDKNPVSDNNSTTSYDFSTGNLYLGWDKAVADRVFKGMIDEVKVWTEEKSSDDIVNNMFTKLNGDEPNLLAYWNFDNLADTATDVTGNGYTGTINGCYYLPSFDTTDVDEDGIRALYDNCPRDTNSEQSDMDNDGIGDECDNDIDGDGVENDIDNCPMTANADQTDIDKDGIGDICDSEIPAGFNFCLNFPGGNNGANSNVTLPKLNISDLPITVEMWCKPEATQNYYSTLWYSRNETSNCGFQYDRWDNPNEVKSVWNGSGVLTSMEPTQDQWNHIALVVTETSRTFYLNGKASTTNGSYSIYPFDSITYLGWDNAGGTDRTFSGQIDEVRVWNTERTVDDITNQMFKPLTGDESGLIGYWNFNDRAEVASDSSANSFDGIINGPTYTLSSVFDTMQYVSSAVAQKSLYSAANTNDNVIACLEIVTENQNNPLSITQIDLQASGTTSFSDVANIKIYSSGSDSTFSTSNMIAELDGVVTQESISLSSDFELANGINYLWITCDIASSAEKGNAIDVNCNRFTLTSTSSANYIPNVNSIGSIIIDPDAVMTKYKFDYDIVTNKAYTTSNGANFVSFQQNAITTYNGYQYLVYWNAAKHVCLARKKMPVGEWEELELTDYTSPHDLGDNHYNISFGICKNDGTIHIAFDHHNDVLHYRMSKTDLTNDTENAAWSNRSFIPTRTFLIIGQSLIDVDTNTSNTNEPWDGNVTYPRFISKPNGDLLFECRSGWSGDGNSHLWEYSNSEWSYIGEYMHGRTGESAGYTSKCGYINGLHYTPGGTRLHASLVWREEFNASTNHEVYYAYSDDDGRTWYNSDDIQIADMASSNPLHYDDEGFKIYSVGQNRGLINQESQAVDSKGGIHILQSYMLDYEADNSSWPSSRYDAWIRHIYQDESGIWQNDSIASVYIDRSEIAVDQYDNLYVVTPGYRVYYASAASKWQNWNEFDLSENATATAEGLIDRDMLLEEHVLSFVFAHSEHSVMNGKVIVPYYLLKHQNPGNGEGCYITTYEGTSFDTQHLQTIDSVNITSTDYIGDSVTVSCEGILETQYAEAYTLYITTSGNTKLFINGELVIDTVGVLETTELTYTLELVPSHNYEIRIEGEYTTDNVTLKAEWSSESQELQIIPKSALYAQYVDVSTGNNSSETVQFNVTCYPNPSETGFTVLVDGNFTYDLVDINGISLESGFATNSCKVGDKLHKGIYYIKISKNKISQIMKVVKM